MKHYFEKIANELALNVKQVQATITLLDEGSTIPFIARYRKEVTDSLDEVQVMNIRNRFQQLRDLNKRRESIFNSLKELEKLSPELEQQLLFAEDMATLEDIYLPYKPKRKTRASVAKEKGLEPLALLVWEQKDIDLEIELINYIDVEKGVNTKEEALAGVSDIIAEMISEQASIRTALRKLFLEKATIKSCVISGKELEAIKYQDYFYWEELLVNVPSHRILAMRRGEKELFLRLDIAPPEEEALCLLEKMILKANNASANVVLTAIQDGYKRLLKPSMETEIRVISKQRADEEAIKVFANNVRQLLLSAPLGQKRILALDPGFRTGCKLVCLDEQGKLVEHATIFPHTGQHQRLDAEKTVRHLVEKYRIEAVGIGNGTASRETENFVRGLGLENLIVVMVNESGASIYSASEVAREEFPDKDVTVRGAVSIGRRLMDPLAELVKIDPKSIGVGQYQHDVDQHQLQHSLDDTVISCVNTVGVELNTASQQLLSYVSGLGSQLAKNIISYRNENGAFSSREALKKVPRLGDKAFEQAAGFLRILNAQHPLDATAVHPERYALVEKMAKDSLCTVQDLISNESLRKQLKLDNYVSEDIGRPTLNDIITELAKPGRDPREQFEVFSFAEGIHEMKDLKKGMRLPGIVTNITKFGVFVDIGVHQDGLIHLSELTNRYISDATEVVKVQQKVYVTVLDVDVDRKRISLSMKNELSKPATKKNTNNAPKDDMKHKLAALQSKFRA